MSCELLALKWFKFLVFRVSTRTPPGCSKGPRSPFICLPPMGFISFSAHQVSSRSNILTACAICCFHCQMSSGPT